jgi:hypothetical protein
VQQRNVEGLSVRKLEKAFLKEKSAADQIQMKCFVFNFYAKIHVENNSRENILFQSDLSIGMRFRGKNGNNLYLATNVLRNTTTIFLMHLDVAQTGL